MGEEIKLPSSEEEISEPADSGEGRPSFESSLTTPSSTEALVLPLVDESEELFRGTGKFASPVLSDLFSVDRFPFFLE